MKQELVWAIIAFAIGGLLGVGSGWGRTTANLDGVNIKLIEISQQLSGLGAKYAESHEKTAVQLGQIEYHLTYNDGRLDKLEARSK